MRKAIVVTALVLLASCGEKETRSDPAADARAVAMVKEMSKPPLIPIKPQEISFADIESNNLFGAGCSFVLPSDKDPIFVGQDEKGWLKLDERIIELVSDQSSDELPSAAWTKYIGLENWLTLSRNAAAEKPSGEETVAAPGEIVIHDSSERVVFRAEGTVDCGA